MKVAGVVVYYNDIDMLVNQFNFGQFESYDSVYIIDGPYEYTTRLEITEKKSVRLSDTDFGRQLLSDSKFKYYYRVWRDEYEKRIFSYEAVSEDLIVLHDTDEFYDVNWAALTEFNNSKYSVGSFSCQNLYINGVSYTNEFYAVSDEAKLPHKPFIFKKLNISSADHINYLWLVGVEQKAADQAKMCRSPVWRGYHFTGMRSREGQRQKFIFYKSLYIHINGLDGVPFISRLKIEVQSQLITADLAEELYLSSIPGYWGIPMPVVGNILTKIIPMNDRLSEIANQVRSQRNLLTSRSTYLVPGVEFFYFIDNQSSVSKLKFESAIKLRLKKWIFKLDVPMSDCEITVEMTSEYRFDRNFSDDILGYLYAVIMDGDIVFDPLVKVDLL